MLLRLRDIRLFLIFFEVIGQFKKWVNFKIESIISKKGPPEKVFQKEHWKILA